MVKKLRNRGSIPSPPLGKISDSVCMQRVRFNRDRAFAAFDLRWEGRGKNGESWIEALPFLERGYAPGKSFELG